jgi:hypothetical protein
VRAPIALALAALASLGTPAHAATVVYGIAIGNDAPPPSGGVQLRYADDDAVRYYELFRRLGKAYLLTAFDANTQRRYPELATVAEPPTLAALMHRVGELASRIAESRRRGDESVVYIAFSGHGAQDHGVPYLALLDGELTQAVLYDRLLAQLRGAYVHLIVDACNANAIVGARGDREVDAAMGPVTDADLRALATERTLARFPLVGAIVSTTAGAQAHEWSRIESGVFTHEVLSGLSGVADVNGDGRIEYSELQAFVSSANRQVRDPRAVPQIIAWPPAGNRRAPLLLLDALRGVSPIGGAVAAIGHFYVELGNGVRYADAHLGEGSLARLFLPPGLAYLVTGDREAMLRPGVTRIEQLRFGPRHEAERGAIDTAYRDGLFAEPFTPTYYRGFVDSAGLPSVGFDTAVRGERRSPSRQRAAIALTTLAGALGATATITGALAIQADRDFAATPYQREATEVSHRYDRYGWAAGVTGVASLALGIAGALLLRR